MGLDYLSGVAESQTASPGEKSLEFYENWWALFYKVVKSPFTKTYIK